MKNVIVVGGGASGLMAAIIAARKGAKVTLLESMEKPGKKILITGNGRCNLTNTDFSREDLYRSEDPAIAWKVIRGFDPDQTKGFFQDLGLLLHEKNGGIYPVTDQASSVLDLLVAEARRWKVKIKCTEKVTKIQKEDLWKVSTASWTYEGDALILACGSKCYPVTGSDGSGYEIVSGLKLNMVPVQPALVPLIIRQSWVKKLAGVRSNANVTLVITEKNGRQQTWSEYGEVQWTDYGVSGIVIFQLSRYANRALEEKKEVVLSIDLFPSMTKEELVSFFTEHKEAKSISELLTGILPKKMIPVILDRMKIKGDIRCEKLELPVFEKLAGFLKEMILQVQGSKSFDTAQVCSGGVSLREIDPSTMEVRKYPGLYLTGELLDVDGMCGGYNLQWAWSSGYLAGKASAIEKV